jgi:parallel beta-helix repeat protein
MEKRWQVGLGVMLILAGFAGMMNLVSENAEGTDVSGLQYDGAGGPWNLTGSPYIVTGNVIIPAGQTLTIEPGVVVKFNGFHGLFIDGNLSAAGTQGNRITITSNKTSPADGDWDTIKVNSTGRVEIHYCDISYSMYGMVFLQSSNNNITNSKIFSHRMRGILLGESSWNNIIGNRINNTVAGDAIAVSLSANNNTIAGNEIYGNSQDGIIIYYSADNNINNNNISGNGNYGLDIYSSKNITITNNSFFSRDGIYLDGNQLYHFNTHTIPENNTVWGNPVKYYKDCSGLTIDGISIGELILANCDNVTAKNLQLNNNDLGMEIAFSTNTTISNNEIEFNEYGVEILHSINLNITNNDISSNERRGMIIHASQEGEIISNTVLFNSGGIYLDSASGFWFKENNVSHGDMGIVVDSSSNNIIEKNDFTLNDYYAINMLGSSNTMFHNRFIDNGFFAGGDQVSGGSGNDWNDQYPIGGNYWSDYSPSCPDNFDGSVTPQTSGSPDGFCDSQYDIDTSNTDYYPLKSEWVYVPPTPETTLPTINNLQPVNQTTIEENQPVISASYSDGTGINTTSVLLMVDGEDVTSLATVTASGISYTPPAVLADGVHTVYLEVYDNSTNNNKATITWSFTVDTAGEEPPPPDEEVLANYWWIAVVIGIVFAVILLILMMMQKKRKEGDAPESKTEEDTSEELKSEET